VSGKTNTLDVIILDREFRIACPKDEQEELLEAVAYLDKKMREIRDLGKVVTVERIAIMAALNITHELLTARLGNGMNVGDLKRKIGALESAIDAALADQDELF
jgi:cell division protein ZapA